MKLSRVMVAASVGLALLPWIAHAACATSTGIIQFKGNGNSAGTLRNLLQGNTVCGRPGTSYSGAPSDRWQEEHQGGPTSGELWDFKLGNGPSVDPRKQVGTWAITTTVSADDTITHSYTGGQPFSWTVFGPQVNTVGTSVYYFCSGTSEFARAYVRSGINVGCGNTFPP